MKRILSMILVLVLLIGMVPVTTRAANAVSITSQPKSATVAEGQKATVTVGATGDGLTYTWYYLNKGESTYLKTTSFTGPTYSVVMNAERDGRKVKCIVKDKYGNSVTTAAATLSLKKPLSITAQPKNVAVAEGKTATVTVGATGEGLTYTWYYLNKGASSYVKTTSFTGPTYSVIMNDARDGRRVRCIVKDKYGNSVTTVAATLSMSSGLKITDQPASVTVAEGQKATVTVGAIGEGLTYTWYYLNKGASSYLKTTSFTGPTYSVIMNADRDGWKVKCIVKDKYGNSVTTVAATLSMSSGLKITSQPKSVTVAEGEVAKVTVGATGEGLTYTWYYMNKGASSYLKTTSFTGNTYSVIMNADRDGRKVRCIVKDKYGNSIKTDAATLSMESPLEITAQPQNVDGEIGDTVSFTVVAVGGTAPYTYQWQIRDDMNDWDDAGAWAEGGQTDTLSFEVAEDEFEGAYEYRCVITDAKGVTVISDAVRVCGRLAIVDEPDHAEAMVGEDASFTVNVTAGTAPYTYQWQWLDTAYGDWENIPNNTAWAHGQQTRTLSFTVNSDEFLEDGQPRYRYRCVITDTDGNTVTTGEVWVIEIKELVVTRQPQSVKGEIGDTVSITVVAEGGTAPYTYQWQIRDDMNDWNDAGAWAEGGQTDTLSFEVVEDEFEGAYEYRCVITDVNGLTVVSDAVRVCGPLKIFGQPKDVFANVGDTVSFSVTVIGGVEPYTYQWQYMNRANSVWKDIAVDFEWATGEQTNRLSFTVGTGEFIDGGEARYSYRCIVTDAEGKTVTSDEAGVTEAGPLTITAQPQNVQNVDVGDQVTFSVTAAGGDRAYGYQWYEKYNYQTSFYEIEGANSATYTRTISENDRKYDVEFFCRVTDGTGAEIDSDSAKATYKLWIKSQSVTLHGHSLTTREIRFVDPLKVTQQPQSVKLTAGETATFTVAAAGGRGEYAYQWEYSYNGGEDWNDADSSGMSGDTTSTLSVKVSESMADYLFRCVITDAGGLTVTTKEVSIA